MEAKRRIDLPKVVVDTTASELTKKAIALLLPLLSALALALIPEVRDRILPVLSKPLLAVIVGLSLSTNLALLFYILLLRKQQRRAKSEIEQVQGEAVRLQDLIDNPPRKFMFGVYWDKDSVPYCKVHKYPLSNLTRLSTNGYIPSFLCEGGHVIPLRDDEGKLLSPVEAKRQFQAAANPQIENQRPREINQPLDDAAPNETLQKTLALLASLKDNPPKHKLDLSGVNEYHALLETAQRELNCNLNEFRIPSSALKHTAIPTPISYDAFGNPSIEYLPVESWCPVDTFKSKIDALMDYLNRRQP